LAKSTQPTPIKGMGLHEKEGSMDTVKLVAIIAIAIALTFIIRRYTSENARRHRHWTKLLKNRDIFKYLSEEGSGLYYFAEIERIEIVGTLVTIHLSRAAKRLLPSDGGVIWIKLHAFTEVVLNSEAMHGYKDEQGRIHFGITMMGGRTTLFPNGEAPFKWEEVVEASSIV